MNKEQILKKAIEKAVGNGYKNRFFERNGWEINYFGTGDKDDIEAMIQCGEGASFDLYTIIFNHDFAKAFWGETEIYYARGESTITDQDYNNEFEYEIFIWQHHLQTMVLEPDPIKYLEKFIN
jgi:hypothetical protein